MKVGEKATYILHLTDEFIKERNKPYNSFKVSFESVESGAFQYGNQTATILTEEASGFERCYDTRYWAGSFDECCRQIISDLYGRNISKVEQI